MRTLEITAYLPCPVRCQYCPQMTLEKNYKGRNTMTLSDFKAALINVPKDVRVDFSGFSEIFCHPEGSQMIRFAFNKGYKVVLYTTTVGMKYSDILHLKGVQFTDLCFHKTKRVDPGKFDNWVQIFEQEVGKGRVAEITDEWKWSRAGNVWERPEVKGAFHCLFAGKEFDHNVLLPNGDIVLCCQDYTNKHILGNIYQTHFDKLNREDYRMASNEVDSDMICRKCELMQKE